ncbi:MAG: response regulator [Desulfobacterales bacterium]|nr:response regulator [Desulfobacterales bacterium]
MEDNRQSESQFCLNMAKKAVKSSNIGLARRYTKRGIDILDDDKWSKCYELCFELHLERVKAEGFSGNIREMQRIAETAEHNAKSLFDKTLLYYTKIQAYISQNQMYEASLTGILILNRMGITFPEKASIIHLSIAYIRNYFEYRDLKPENFLSLPEMKDNLSILSIEIMASIALSLYMTDYKLFTLLVLRSISITLKKGVCPQSALLCSFYALILCKNSKKIDTAYNFGRTALKLAEKFNDKAIKAKILFIFHTFIDHWKTPFKQRLVSLEEAYKESIETSNSTYSGFAAGSSLVTSFIIGQHLSEVKDKLNLYSESLRKVKNDTAIFIHRLFHQIVLNLMGDTKEPWILSGEAFDENSIFKLNTYSINNNSTALCLFHLNKLILCYTFMEYEKALYHASIAKKYIAGISGMSHEPLFYFYEALAKIAVFSGLMPYIEQKKILFNVYLNKQKIKNWAKHCPYNHLHKLLILEAELAKIRRMDAKAMLLFDKAVKMAKENEFINEEGLANEHAARFWLKQGKEDIAGIYLKKAYSLYILWGASRKAKHLEEKFPKYFTALSFGEERSFNETVTVSGSSSSTGRMSEPLDLSAVIKASQAISGEIVLKDLLKKLITIAVKYSEAERGLLLLKENNKLAVQAKADALKNMSEVFSPIYIENFEFLSHSIVDQTLMNNESVVVTNPVNAVKFFNDEYIKSKKPLSILSIPMVRHGILTGLLYLENFSSIGSFTSKKIEMLSLIASQASISIENAKFYIELEESERKYRMLYENAIEGVFQCNADGRFISANPSMVKILGFESQDELKSSVVDIRKEGFVFQQDRESFEALLHNHNKVSGFETQFFKKDGSIFWGSLSLRCVFVEKEELKYYEGSLVDITERKEKEKAERERAIAEESHRQLKELDRMKSDFLSSVSHELRTPLTSVLGFAKLIRKDFYKMFVATSESDPKLMKKAKNIDKNLEIIIEESKRLTRLINDVLNLAKIESGKIEWRDSIFSVKDLLEQAVSAISGELSSKPDIRLVVRIKDDVYIKADRDRMMQVLINLLNNAFKFTKKGKVEIESFLDSKKFSEDKDYVMFKVKDTGLGIREADIEKIFDKFHQASHGETFLDKPKGTGLGLSICRHIISNYGGKIWAESELDKGTVFTFIIPAYYPGTDTIESDYDNTIMNEEEELNVNKKDKPLILVVDDDPYIQNFISQLLENEGFKVITASDGLSAISAAKMNMPDLITMDIVMKGMDGITAISQLKNDPYLKDIPIIVISVLSERDKAGADAALAKPLNEAMLIENIYSLIKTGKILGGFSCMLVEPNSGINEEDIEDICQCPIMICKVEEIWDKINDGFKGTIIISSEISKDIDIEELSRKKDIQVVILPK